MQHTCIVDIYKAKNGKTGSKRINDIAMRQRVADFFHCVPSVWGESLVNPQTRDAACAVADAFFCTLVPDATLNPRNCVVFTDKLMDLLQQQGMHTYSNKHAYHELFARLRALKHKHTHHTIADDDAKDKQESSDSSSESEEEEDKQESSQSSGSSSESEQEEDQDEASDASDGDGDKQELATERRKNNDVDAHIHTRPRDF